MKDFKGWSHIPLCIKCKGTTIQVDDKIVFCPDCKHSFHELETEDWTPNPNYKEEAK